MASRFVQIFDVTSTPVAGSTEGEIAEKKMAKDARSKTSRFSLLGYIFTDASCSPQPGVNLSIRFKDLE